MNVDKSKLIGPHLYQCLQLNCCWYIPIYHVVGGFNCFCSTLGRPGVLNIALILFARVLFIRSATPFCWGVYVTVNWLLIPSHLQSARNSPSLYSVPLSALKQLILFSDSSSTRALKSLNTGNTHDFLLIGYTRHLLEWSSMKDTKYFTPPRACWFMLIHYERLDSFWCLGIYLHLS